MAIPTAHNSLVPFTGAPSVHDQEEEDSSIEEVPETQPDKPNPYDNPEAEERTVRVFRRMPRARQDEFLRTGSRTVRGLNHRVVELEEQHQRNSEWQEKMGQQLLDLAAIIQNDCVPKEQEKEMQQLDERKQRVGKQVAQQRALKYLFTGGWVPDGMRAVANVARRVLTQGGRLIPEPVMRAVRELKPSGRLLLVGFFLFFIKQHPVSVPLRFLLPGVVLPLVERPYQDLVSWSRLLGHQTSVRV